MYEYRIKPASPKKKLQSFSFCLTCFLACNDDTKCEAVTMKWVDAGDVECFKRGGLTLKDCEPTPPDADDIYSTYTKD